MKNNGIFKAICLQSWLILAIVFGLISTPVAADVLVNNQGKYGYADENGKLIGDCEKELPVAFQSPVPGGCGLLTRLAVIENLILLSKDNGVIVCE